MSSFQRIDEASQQANKQNKQLPCISFCSWNPAAAVIMKLALYSWPLNKKDSVLKKAHVVSFWCLYCHHSSILNGGWNVLCMPTVVRCEKVVNILKMLLHLCSTGREYMMYFWSVQVTIVKLISKSHNKPRGIAL